MLRISSARFGLGIFAGVLALGAALLISPGSKIENWKLKISEPALAGTTASTSITAANSTPSVTALTLNNASSIILTANTTTAVTVSFTVSDDNGCGTVFTSGFVTTTLYREGVSTTCAVGDPALSNRNYLNCYVVSTTTHNCVSTSTSAQATTTFNVWYFAEATDASSTYPAQTWAAYVSATDNSSTYSTTTATGQELLSLLGLNVETSSLNYGTVNPGTDTTSTNQTAQVKNAGNSSTTLRLNGTAMTSGGNTIATTSQHYSTSTFTYNTNDNQLQETATDVGGFSVPRPPLTAWRETTNLPIRRYHHRSVVYNGYVYVIGGIAAGSITSTVLYAPIGATATLGAWAETTPLPTSTERHDAVVNNGYLYVIGGRGATSTLVTSTVIYAPIGTTGTIGAWAATTPLASATEYHATFVNNGYMYTSGGADSATVTSTVLYASINSTGSLGTWTATTPLPRRTNRHAAITYNGYVYVIGGQDSTIVTSSVYVAPFGTTGTIGSWTATAALPSATNRHAAAVNNGYLYSIGGDTEPIFTSTVLYAPIGATGTIGSWAATTPLPTGTARLGVAMNNGFLYVTGGDNDTGNTSTVLYASLASRNTYWGWGVTAGQAAGTYNGQNTFTAVFQP